MLFSVLYCVLVIIEIDTIHEYAVAWRNGMASDCKHEGYRFDFYMKYII